MRPPSQRSGNETRGHAARRGQLSGWREARGFTAIEGPVSVPAPSLYDAQLWGEPSWGLLVPDRESFSLEGPRKCLKVHTGAQETTAGGRGWQPLGQERCPSRASGAPLDREQVLAAGHVPCAGSQRHPVCLPWRVLLPGRGRAEPPPAPEGREGRQAPVSPGDRTSPISRPRARARSPQPEGNSVCAQQAPATFLAASVCPARRRMPRLGHAVNLGVCVGLSWGCPHHG